MKELEISALLKECAATKGGALLISMISEAALRRMGSDPVKIQQQAGVLNLYIDINDYLTMTGE